MATGSWSHYHGVEHHFHPYGVDCDFEGATDFAPVFAPVEMASIDEWYISISTRIATTSGADQLYWRFLEFAKEIRPANLDYVSVTCSKVGDEEEESAGPEEYHDENTMFKVRDAIKHALLNHKGDLQQDIDETITSLQNYGIKFREVR